MLWLGGAGSSALLSTTQNCGNNRPWADLPLTVISEALPLWYQAYESPLGIIIFASNPASAASILRTARKQEGEPKLFELTVREKPGQVWIVRTVPRGGEAE